MAAEAVNRQQKNHTADNAAWRNRPSRSRAQSKKNTRPPDIIAMGTMDYTIFLVVVILTLIGVVMVFSSSYVMAATEETFNYDTFYFLKRNGLLALGGLLVMYLFATINYRLVQRFALIIYAAALALSAVVTVFGISSHGKMRWIPLPIPGFNQFQPSEVAKAALVFMLAYVISRSPDITKKWSGFLFCMGLVAMLAGLTVIGSLSSAIIITVIGVGMIFTASPYVMRFILMGVTGAGGLVAYLSYASTHTETDAFRGGRFAAWLDPWSDPLKFGFQPIQSLYAIASGGMFGLGIGQSRQKSYLPEMHNDYIFSIICEELGLIGAATVLLLFGIFVWRGIRVALRAPDTFTAMTAAGIVLTIASQVVINVAVVTNTIPSTGVTLPFVSYGGTSLLVCMAMTGVLLNISRCSKES